MAEGWTRLLARWTTAGLIDPETAERIRAFEQRHARSAGLGWPILLALGFGALLMGAGVLLFISAHWDGMSPASRFALVLAVVAVFHVGGALLSDRSPALATTLHAIGTVALGAGIYLSGQVFNLDEHWPGGLMLWAFGAALAWLILGDLTQMALVALLVPAWLSGEWFVAVGPRAMAGGIQVLVAGHFLLSLTYFTAVRPGQADVRRRALMWIGGVMLPFAAIHLAVTDVFPNNVSLLPLPPTLKAVGWTVAVGLPLAVALVLRRQSAWLNVLSIVWAVVALDVDVTAGRVAEYAWWGLGAVGLTAWGVYERRAERVNIGAAMFAVTVMTFYFSQVMDKLDRSASLVGFGILFLAGGWALERLRRRLIHQTRETGA